MRLETLASKVLSMIDFATQYLGSIKNIESVLKLSPMISPSQIERLQKSMIELDQKLQSVSVVIKTANNNNRRNKN